MKKIALIVDSSSFNSSNEDTLRKLTEDFSIFNGEITFFGENPEGRIRPLEELDRFTGQVIDLRDKEDDSSHNLDDPDKKIRVAVDVRTASIWHHVQQGIGHNIRAQLKALQKHRDKIAITLLYDTGVGISEDLKELDYSLQPFTEFDPDYYDLIHLTNPLTDIEKFPLFPADKRGLPVLSNFYDTIPIVFDELYFGKAPEKRKEFYDRIDEMRRFIDHYVTISENTREDMSRYLSIDKKDTTLMMAGVDDIYFEDSDFKLDDNSRGILDPDKPFILYAGSHDHRKRIDYLFSAFNRIHQELAGEIQLVLTGFYIHGFEESYSLYGAIPEVSEDIKLLHYVPEESLIWLYKNAKALVFSSLYEGFGLPIVEAMAAGRPVVAFNNSSIAEVAGDAALLVDNGNNESLAEGALRFLKDEGLRNEYIAKGKARAGQFTWERVGYKTVEAYFETLEKKKDSSRLQTEAAPEIEEDRFEIEQKPIVSSPENGDPRNIKVTVEGTFLDKSGYALHSRHMALGLDKLGADVNLNVCWFAGAPDIEKVDPEAPKEDDAIYLNQDNGELIKYNTPVEPEKAQRIVELAQNHSDPSDRTLVVNLPADSPDDPIYKRVRESRKGFRKYVGYTMFEMADLPRGWVEGCSYMDEVWVPTQFNRESFSRAGVPESKIKIVPLGVDHELFDPDRVPEADVPGVKGFNFLSIFQWTKRKGWDVLLRAYLKAFSQEDDVALVIRSYYSRGVEVESRVREFIEEQGHDVNKIPRISIISEPIPTAHMPSLYKRCQAFVLPSRGEGWGLPYMEAMTMGLPTIGTRFSAQTEFMNDSNSYLIDNLGTELVDEEQVQDSPLYLGTSWGIPSLDHTIELMRHVYENHSEAQEIGRRARQEILDNWTVKNQVKRTAEALLEGEAVSSKSEQQKIPSLRIKLNDIASPAIVSGVGDRPLRVAMQNRPQALEAPGGDTVVMQQLKKELEKLGVRVDYQLKVEEISDYDVVHAFNFALPDMLKLYAENAEKEKKPFVITPMYEDWPNFIYPGFKLHYLFDEYIEKGQPREIFPELMERLNNLEPHHKADNSFNVKLAHAITPSGEIEAEHVKGDYPYARNVVPVYLGCDLPSADVGPELFIKETGLKDFVFCVGRIETRKNQLMLLKALEDVDVPVVLASGGYTYQMPYLELCKQFKRRGQTVILGRLSDEMLVSAYRAAKVHALPSWYELPGMVSVEAAHYDCNVVASPRGTIKDYLSDFGYYAEPDDPEALKLAVLDALEKPVNPLQKEHVRQFTWKASAKTTLEVYMKAIEANNEISTVLNQADEYRKRGDIDDALSKYEKTLSLHPHNRKALQACIEIYSLNRDSRAESLRKAVDEMSIERRKTSFPDIPRDLNDEFRFPERSSSHLVPSATTTEPDIESDRIKEAKELLKKQDYFEAESVFKEELEIDTQSYEALYSLGKIEFYRSNYSEAKDYFERAVSANITGKALIKLAECWEKLNDYDAALESLNRIKTIPRVNGDFDFDINRLRGHCLLKKGDYDGAEKYYTEALRLNSDSEKPHLGLGSLELLRGNREKAESHYNQALNINIHSDKALLGLAILALESGNNDDALEKVAEALEMNIENQQAVLLCLQAAHQANRLEIAEKYLSKYISLHPANADIQYSLAGVRFSLGDVEGALDAAQKVLIFNPDHAPASELIEQLGQPV